MTTVNEPEVAPGDSGAGADALQMFAQSSSQEARASRLCASNKTRAPAERAVSEKRPGAVFIVERESGVMTIGAAWGGSGCGPLSSTETLGVKAENTQRYRAGREGLRASRGLTSASQSEGACSGLTGCAIWVLGSSG
jgi:hypothetical protein